jgi:hypothetical protein
LPRDIAIFAHLAPLLPPLPLDMGQELIQPERTEQAVLLIRGQRVMLDRDLAALYGVETKSSNKAVQRNPDRFPADFVFELAADEAQACLASRFQKS